MSLPTSVLSIVEISLAMPTYPIGPPCLQDPETMQESG
jgi:hypothetical protein